MEKIVKEIRKRTPLQGFVEFVREKGIVGLAIGLAIGTQATDLVKNVVSSIVTPILNLLVGPKGVSGLVWNVTIGDRSATFTFGVLLDAIIRFLAVAFVIYIAVKLVNLDRFDKKPEVVEAVEAPKKATPKKKTAAKKAK